MLVRILQFLLGALAGGGGGYLVWMNRADIGALFPPGPSGPPWMIVAGALGVAAGVVFLVSAVHPRPNRRREMEAREARREAHLGEAEAYYAEAGRAADRDWRSGDIPAPVTPQPVAPQPAAPQPVAPQPVAAPPPPPPQPAPVPPPQPAPVAPPPVAAAPPPPAPPAPQPAAPPASPAVFPATATLAPIPAAVEPPPAIPAAPAPASVPAATPAAPDPHAPIRAALKAGQLAEAERLLEVGRETAQGLALAELTGLAGDHAAAAGRQSHAKWLWRLAIKRFGEEGAMDTPAAKAVSESLRVSG